MKKVISILLLVIFLFNICGFYIVFNVIEHDNRIAMNTLIRGNKSVAAKGISILKIKESSAIGQSREVEYVRENEIRYKGNLYDIIEVKSAGDFVYYYCISDKKEEKLKKALCNYVEGNILDSRSKSSNTKGHDRFLKNVIKDYILSQNSVCCITESVFSYSPEVQHSYKSVYSKIFHPPPRLS